MEQQEAAYAQIISSARNKVAASLSPRERINPVSAMDLFVTFRPLA